MQRRRNIRLTTVEALEDRSVPSGFGFPFGFGFGSGGSVQAQDARQVSQAFRTFQQTYALDVQMLVAPGGSASTFNSNVQQALTTLDQNVDTIIGNLPSASTLKTTIDGELLGTTGTTLQANLANLTLPTSTSTNQEVRAFIRASNGLINSSAVTVESQIRTSPPPTGTITSQTLRSAISEVRTAFRTFGGSYFGAFQTYISALESSSGGSTSGAASTFHSAVQTALGQLNTSVLAAANGLGLTASESSSLDTTLTNDLLSNSSNSGNLQSQLATLTLPSKARSLSTLFFTIRSHLDIGAAQGNVDLDIRNAVQQHNSSL